jgi:hypothetical protein
MAKENRNRSICLKEGVINNETSLENTDAGNGNSVKLLTICGLWRAKGKEGWEQKA